ncbi:GNAT family N-acetyltransferase [Kitasatospora sp. KL5]|uniref:GNAT family N-acetyltransferase n=1 Tax=Kitasatospora sp. KL5 TaxID=3425125 RepID=UPI003D6FB73B
MITVRTATHCDYPVADDLLALEGLGDGTGLPEFWQAAVACCLTSGEVIGVVEFDLAYNLGHDSQRPAHPGDQVWVFALAVRADRRGQGVGSRLLRFVAEEGRKAGRTFLALYVQEGGTDTESRARARFFASRGLVSIANSAGDNTLGAALEDLNF